MSDVSGKNKIAIIGMSCIFPGAANLSDFWTNIVRGKDSLRDATEAEWDPDQYFNENPTKFEDIYCKRGGFITDFVDFDPFKHGIMPKSIHGADPDQLLSIKVAAETLADAGFEPPQSDANKYDVILGRTSAPGAGMMNMIQLGQTVKQVVEIVKSLNPELNADQLAVIKAELQKSLRDCNSDTVPGVMPNVLAGRIAGRFGFKGRSLILDAACASSLTAVEIGVRGLLSGQSDLVLAGGLHVNSFAAFHQMFCALGALSKRQQIRPFDNLADGTLLGEGLGMVVLKRFNDAVRDGNRIYATVCGVGSSSDGQGTSMLAPYVQGEALALTRAYEMAGISPRTVELLEAHGTGTPTGDLAELRAMQKVFGEVEDEASAWCALGGVKSMIGHAQAAGGIAGLIKAALSLYNKILPPTLNVEQPLAQFDWNRSPGYINTIAQPWLTTKQLEPTPRRAAVNAFGFGGVNAHAILEEHAQAEDKTSAVLQWPYEQCFFSAATRDELIEQLTDFKNEINQSSKLLHCSYTLWQRHLARTSSHRSVPAIQSKKAPTSLSDANPDEAIAFETLSIISESTHQLMQQLEEAISKLNAGVAPASPDVYYSNGKNKHGDSNVAFVMSATATADAESFRELTLYLPSVRNSLEEIETTLRNEVKNLPKDLFFRRAFSNAVRPAAADVLLNIAVNYSHTELCKQLKVTPKTSIWCEAATLMTSVGSECQLLTHQRHRALNACNERSPLRKSTASDKQCVDGHTEAGADDAQTLEQAISQLIDSNPEPLTLILTGPYSGEIHKICATRVPTMVSLSAPNVSPMLQLNRAVAALLATGIPVDLGFLFTGRDPHLLERSQPSKKTTSIKLDLRYPVLKLSDETIQNITSSSSKNAWSPIAPSVPVSTRSPAPNRAARIQEDPYTGIPTTVPADTGVSNAAVVRTLPSSVIPDRSLEPSRLATTFNADPSAGFLQQTDAADPSPFSSAHETSLNFPVTNSFEHIDVCAAEEQSESLVINNFLGVVSGFHRESNLTHELVMNQYLLSPEAEIPFVSGLADSGFCSGSQSYGQLSATNSTSAVQYPGLATEYPTSKVSVPRSGSQDRASYLHAQSIFPAPHLPLLRNGLTRFTRSDTTATADVLLTLDSHRYLNDHAVGGVVSIGNQGIPERVCLMPMTVAIEMMAEIAAVIVPNMKAVKFSNIKALKPIRVTSQGCHVRVSAAIDVKRSGFLSPKILDARIELISDENTAPVLSMQCAVHMATAHAQTTQLRFEDETIRQPLLNPHELYSSATMFHGPRMQSTVQLTASGSQVTAALVAKRSAVDWLEKEQSPVFIADPLLLDNVAQTVFFHLFENQIEAQALLPFLVDSLEIFTDLNSLNQQVYKTASHMRSINDIGTVADAYLLDQNDTVLAKFNLIYSKRIALDSRWSAFIREPAAILLSDLVEGITAPNTLSTASTQFPAHSISVSIHAEEIPEDLAVSNWLADYLLTQSESIEFKNTQKPELRREWLAIRILCKDLFRFALSKNGLLTCPADLEVRQTETPGQFIAYGTGTAASYHAYISVNQQANHYTATLVQLNAAP